MADPWARDVDTIDGQLSSLRSLNADATEQLASVRRRIAELESHELTLIGAIDARERRIDSLLDERLRAMAAGRMVKA